MRVRDADTLAGGFATRDVEHLLSLVREVAQAPEFLDSLAWHPLGFFRGELGLDGAGSRYVLHCWPRGVRRTQEPRWTTHCHAWPLDSVVIGGSLLDEQFDRLAYDGSSGGRLYMTSNQGDVSYLLRQDACVGLASRSANRWRAGDGYDIPARTFHHTTVARDGFCMTVARIGNRVAKVSEVIGAVDGPDRLSYVQVPVDRRLLEEAIGDGEGGAGV